MKNLLTTLSVFLFVPLLACGQAVGETYVAGENYDVINPPVRTSDPAKVEVVEFFWYGCGHCYNFEPLLEVWKETLPEDVDFRGSPAMWNPMMELHARAFYAAEVLGVLDEMNSVIFQAMNVDKKPLASEGEIEALFVANGVSAEDFSKAFNSFGVTSQVNQAAARARAAKITGTPAMMVNGKYHISSRKAGSQADMLKVADFLIAKEQAAAQN
ncbi:MAG: thiol:disulfide interchange protein DsbA/DsbL [Pseudomonadota bacterium]